jgi:hypothetical protein
MLLNFQKARIIMIEMIHIEFKQHINAESSLFL